MLVNYRQSLQIAHKSNTGINRNSVNIHKYIS